MARMKSNQADSLNTEMKNKTKNKYNSNMLETQLVEQCSMFTKITNTIYTYTKTNKARINNI